MSHAETEHYEVVRLSPLLTITETAELLGIARSTAFRLIRQGELQTVRVGKRRRVRQEDIAAYLTREGDVAP